jgi:hypothetical protein
MGYDGMKVEIATVFFTSAVVPQKRKNLSFIHVKAESVDSYLGAE